MAKLVEELQKECLNSKVSVTDLLRKARFVAQKLDAKEMFEFCTNEIEGYSKKSVPDYRNVLVEYKAFNPLKGWVPIEVPSGPLSSILERHLVISVGEMEEMLKRDSAIACISVPADCQQQLCKWIGLPFELEIKSFFPKKEFIRIFNIVRNKISDWALDLERKGIWGGEYVFPTDEKENARSTSITNNFNAPINGANIVGTATNSTLNVNNTNSFDYEGVKKLLESVQKLLPAGNFAKDDLEKIQQDIYEIKESISKQDVPSVKGKLKDLADFCKGIAGNVIASGVWAQIQPFLC